MSAPREGRAPALPHLVHKGSLEAAAFLVDAASLRSDEAQRRVLALWEPGAVVQRVGARRPGADGEGWLVRLARPRRVRVELAPGLPLAAEGSLLVAAPLGPTDLARCAAPAGALVRFRGGAVEVVAPKPTDVEDIARWLDLSAYSLLEGRPLGAPAPAPAVAPSGATSVAVRGMFGHAVPPPPTELAGVLAALAKMRERGGPAAADRAAGTRGTQSGRAPGSAERSGWLRRFFAALATVLAHIAPTPKPAATPSRARARAPTAGTSRRLAVRDAAPRGPGLLSRLLTRMHDLFARALLKTRLAEYLGRRQAEYLGRMMAMFEEGNLAEALRHAIPLGSEGEQPSPTLGLPSPRGALDIRPEQAGSSSSLLLGGELFGDLRRLYRKAFERLDADGRVDEAAFVLAELLRAHEEAVSYLERHDRLRLAAQVAEARGLPPGLVVRQWFLAGERGRAIALARRSGSFADAVQRLEKAGSPAAQPLRLLWAEALAAAGDFAAAVEVAWPIEAARALARAWIDRAIEQGGVAGAALLARKLELAPDAFAELWATSAALLDADHDGAGEERKAFANELAGGTSAETRAVVAPTARALIRDASAGRGGDGALVRRLVPRALDAALRADVPANFGEPPPAAAGALGDFVVGAHDAGSMPILDAVALTRGRFLVALGEAGVSLIGPDGRRLAHFDQPAHHLVPSDRGDRAIAIAPRGEAVRLGRIDVAARRSEAWTEARLSAWARDFDGAEWVVATHDAVLRIDVTLDRLEALAAVASDVGRVSAVSRSPSRGAFVVARGTHAEPRGAERWRYDLPGWILRGKNELAGGAPLPIGLSSDGACAALRSSPGAGALPDVFLELSGDGSHKQHALGADIRARAVVVEGRWVVVESADDAGVVLHVVDQHALRAAGTLGLAGARAVSLRLCAGRLLVADDRGRVLLVDLGRGAIVANLRI